jgi:hypothetical protein
MTKEQWIERKKKVIRPLKYFWKTMQIIQVTDPITKEVSNREVPHQGTYRKSTETI